MAKLCRNYDKIMAKLWRNYAEIMAFSMPCIRIVIRIFTRIIIRISSG